MLKIYKNRETLLSQEFNTKFLNGKEIYDILKNNKIKMDLITSLIQTIDIDGKKKKIMFTHFPLFKKPVKENKIDYDKKYQDIIKILEFTYLYYNCELNIHGHVHSNKFDGYYIENSIILNEEKEDENINKLLPNNIKNINVSIEVLKDMKPILIDSI